MKKLLLFFISIASVTVLLGMSCIEIKPTLNANNILLAVENTGRKISLMELSKINTKDFQELTKRKMSFSERLQFRIAQKKLRNSLNEEGTFSKRKVEKFFEKAKEGGGFDAGGFFLGLFLSWVGVLIAYLIDDDKKKNRVKWAWIGLGVEVVFFVIIIISFASVSF